MKKQFAIIMMLILLSFVVNAQATEADLLDNAENSARTWLALLDEERYNDSWNSSSSLLQQNKAAQDWVNTMKSIRAPLGAMGNRYLATAAKAESLPKLPDGEYIVLQFYTTFAVKGLAMETISLAKQPDNNWLVAAYEIK